MKLVSMKKAEQNDTAPDPDDYGYGLMLYLDDDQLQALGLAALPDVGTVMDIQAKAVVMRIVQENDGEGAEKRLNLQITDLGVQKTDQRTAADKLYGNQPAPEMDGD